MKFVCAVLLLFWSTNLSAQNTCLTLHESLQIGDIDGAIQLIAQIGESTDPQCNNLIGEAYLKRGRNDLAETFFKKALKETPPNSETQAHSLNNLGLVYWNTGNNSLAKDFLLQALHIRLDLFGESHEKTAASFNDLGLVLSNNNPDAALQYYEQAQFIYETLEGIHTEKIAQSKLNVGIIFR